MTASLRLRDGVVAQVLEQEMVLLDTLGGQYFDLNPSGTVMLEGLLKGASRDQIVADLSQRFAVDAERAAQDMDRLVAQLLKAGLVVEAERM